MLVWNWKVRIYNTAEMYGVAQLVTERDLHDIETIQEFYMNLTGHKMVIEGMSEQPYENIPFINGVFNTLWKAK